MLVRTLLHHVAYQASWAPREDLLQLCWPDRDDLKARANLRQLLDADPFDGRTARPLGIGHWKRYVETE